MLLYPRGLPFVDCTLTSIFGLTATPEELANFAVLVGQFQSYAPEFKGPITTEESVMKQLAVMEKVTMKDSGGFLSHHGNKIWL
jgi:hypothetical protein